MTTNLPGTLLLPREAPPLVAGQLNLFDQSSLLATPVANFDPQHTQETILSLVGQQVIAVDLGGDKAAATTFIVNPAGRLTPLDPPPVHATLKSHQGQGYLEFLQTIAAQADQLNLPVGISTAGILEGTRLIQSPNLSQLLPELHQNYSSDFTRLFSTPVAVVNDAVAGVMAGSLEALKHRPVDHLIYLINGGGLGGAVLNQGVIFATEPGHIPIIPQLNPFDQSSPCGVNGANHVCLERVASSGAGVEAIWYQKTGQALTGQDISQLYQQDDPLALQLYRYSALVTAHAVAGMAKAFDLPDQPQAPAVVYHGGIFKVPGYSQMVGDILRQANHPWPAVFTQDFTSNACLQGAGVAALAPTFT